MAHEPSSVFVYEMIRAFGGEEAFYSKFYISAVCPLGFTNLSTNPLTNLSSSERHESVYLDHHVYPDHQTLKGTPYALRIGGQLDGKVHEVNYNYYDSKELTACVSDFIVENLKTQLSFGVKRDVCFCLGTGKNEKFLSELNNHYGFFERIVALEHPRYIMQYKNKRKGEYIDKYIQAFQQVQP